MQKTVFMWGVPRSVSTAFEKTFSNRNDTKTVHEPFAECYYFGPEKKSNRYGVEKNKEHYTKEEAFNRIFNNNSPLTFVKDLSFQAHHYIDNKFLESVTNTFIIRHPYKVFSSLKKLKPDFTEEEFGFISLEKVWEKVHEIQTSAPILVEGTIFQKTPEIVLKEYCKNIDVDYISNMLSWEDGKLQEWGKGDEEVHTKWHNTLGSSNSIIAKTAKELDLEMNLKQEKIINKAIDIYERILPYAIK